MLRFIPLLVAVSLSQLSQASVFGEHSRGAEVSDNYPASLAVGRFSEALVDGKSCDWEHADDIHLKTDRGNYKLSSYTVAPDSIKILCEGKRPFYMFNIPAKYLGPAAQQGDVAVWFGKEKDRAGCEGYVGCDKVHVLELYHTVVEGKEGAEELQDW
ncbi:hypothetical protein [Oceanicoccus sagamiensis]|uniref:Uncharacterized protein n=1 Tax=Oceanicoccus sagamiensis TaxID=716816 RepID=A0A1X9NAE0_9GAMM|nr:hypothetical protein [Oceanicoccus sagamiensis]ARN73402.1 hypothetical protein BST96_04315 [Oceanicoccus sagamiensis]